MTEPGGGFSTTGHPGRTRDGLEGEDCWIYPGLRSHKKTRKEIICVEEIRIPLTVM